MACSISCIKIVYASGTDVGVAEYINVMPFSSTKQVISFTFSCLFHPFDGNVVYISFSICPFLFLIGLFPQLFPTCVEIFPLCFLYCWSA